MRALAVVLAVLVAGSAQSRAERPSEIDPLWYLLSTSKIALDEKALSSSGENSANTRTLAETQADLLLLADGLESFRDEAQVKDTLKRLEPNIVPALRPRFRDRSESLNAIYRTLAVIDDTWALRFPEPPCSPAEARSRLLSASDGLFRETNGQASPWLVNLLGPQARGLSAEAALDRASSSKRLEGAEYERRRVQIRKLTLALASDKAVGAARSKLYCARAAAFEDLALAHATRAVEPALAARATPGADPAGSVLVVVSGGRRAAATWLAAKDGPVLVTDAAVVSDAESVRVFARDQSSEMAEATVLRRDPAAGLAVLTTKLRRPALTLASKTPAQDDFVTALGHAETSGLWTRTSGLVTKSGPASFQTDAVIAADFSGGPVLDESGEVVGILIQRPADADEGRWPVALPAESVKRWLEGEPVTASASVEAIEEGGSAAVLSRARPNPLIESSVSGGYAASLPTAPEGHIVCMKYCESPGSSGSADSSYSSGSSQLGQAIGQLGAVIITKGLSALFRGIGSFFQSKPSASQHKVVQAPPIAQIETKKVEEKRPDPPKITCRVETVNTPASIGKDEAELTVRFSCDSDKVPLEGHSVTFTLGWDGQKQQYDKIERRTDAQGYASIKFRVSNPKTNAERSMDDLNKYDPDKRPSVQNAPDDGLINTASPGVAKTSTTVTAVEALTLVGTGTKVRSLIRFVPAGAGAIPTAGESIVASGLVAGAAITITGASLVVVVNHSLNEMIAAQDKYNDAIDTRMPQRDKFALLDKEAKDEDECSLRQGEEVIDRFLDETRLAQGFLRRHEGPGHTIAEHVGKSAVFLRNRIKREGKREASSYFERVTAERIIRTAVLDEVVGITAWYTNRINKRDYEIRYSGQYAEPIGNSISYENIDLVVPKYDAVSILRKLPSCKILILTSYPE